MRNKSFFRVGGPCTVMVLLGSFVFVFIIIIIIIFKYFTNIQYLFYQTTIILYMKKRKQYYLKGSKSLMFNVFLDLILFTWRKLFKKKPTQMNE